MNEPIHKDNVPPFTLEVFYEDSSFRIVITKETGEKREKTIPATYEPVFGIDVADMANINQEAEEMCIEMEREQDA